MLFRSNAEPAPPSACDAATRQIGLFDAQAQRLRAALDAIARTDMAAAVSILGGITSELEPAVNQLLHGM